MALLCRFKAGVGSAVQVWALRRVLLDIPVITCFRGYHNGSWNVKTVISYGRFSTKGAQRGIPEYGATFDPQMTDIDVQNSLSGGVRRPRCRSRHCSSWKAVTFCCFDRSVWHLAHKRGLFAPNWARFYSCPTVRSGLRWRGGAMGRRDYADGWGHGSTGLTRTGWHAVSTAVHAVSTDGHTVRTVMRSCRFRYLVATVPQPDPSWRWAIGQSWSALQA